MLRRVGGGPPAARAAHSAAADAAARGCRQLPSRFSSLVHQLPNSEPQQNTTNETDTDLRPRFTAGVRAQGLRGAAMICCSARRPKRQLFVQKDHVTGANFLTATDGEPFNPSPNAVLILTLRMGFGHLRIAHAVASWLDGCEAYVYDLLATDTPESESLKRYEWIYSKFSKVASASGGPIEWAFDKFLTSGDASAQCVPARPPPARPPSSDPARVPCLTHSLRGIGQEQASRRGSPVEAADRRHPAGHHGRGDARGGGAHRGRGGLP